MNSIRNNEGYLASDLIENDTVAKLFEKKQEQPIKITNLDFKEINNKKSENENGNEQKSKMQKPSIVKGHLYKIGNSGFRLNKRFFVLNADEGTLIRFACEEDFPLKPM